MFVVQGARVFDGESVIGTSSVLVDDNKIVAVDDRVDVPDGTEVVDGRGKTLLPGLIDSHAHPQPPALEQAIVFGVTTELDMFSCPEWMLGQRQLAASRDDMADVRSSSIGVTVPGGHPSHMMKVSLGVEIPTVTEVGEVAEFVAARVAEGADYIKLAIDDGCALGVVLPALTPELTAAVVREAHRHHKMALAHVMTADSARQAIDAGVDGLVHVFMDQPPTADIVTAIAAAGVFVVPTLSTLGALAGDISGEHLANDLRVARFLSPGWRENLCARREPGVGTGALRHALDATRALHEAGVDILAGTDTAWIGVPGTAHGVSMHGELDLLVQAGLTPVQALRAATSQPARRFGLTDRGRLRPGLQADMVLIDGDPTTTIDDSLSIHTIWRRGQRLDREPSGRVQQ